MLSKREKLLIRPWQQRRYDNHRRKVQSALPAIDNKTPQNRPHITVKLKKCQQEVDRTAKIQKDNFILLKKLSYIMKTNRVDNYWNTPPPNFLNRISMYDFPQRKKIVYMEEKPFEKTTHIRKSKCSACTPKPPTPPSIPEERIPWEPKKPSISRKRSQSVPPKRSVPIIQEKLKDLQEKGVESSIKPDSIRSKSCKANQRFLERKTIIEDECLKSPRSFLLEKGNLKLSINFPSDTSVTVRDGLLEYPLFKDDCYCTSMGKVY
nr:uncharacterized protein LOC111428024 [Onthophagus taurus]